MPFLLGVIRSAINSGQVSSNLIIFQFATVGEESHANHQLSRLHHLFLVLLHRSISLILYI